MTTTTKQKQTHKYREQTAGCQGRVRERWTKWVKMWERVQSSSYRVSHRNERYYIGNTVNVLVIALYGDRWYVYLWAQHKVQN